MSAVASGLRERTSARRSPFVGLEPYTEEDARFFFGREREQRVITANLRSNRLTLVYGASGVGKSSVLMAGVMLGLRRRAAAQAAGAARIAGARRPGPPSPAAVVPVYFTDWRDERPLERLLEAMRAAAAPTLGEASSPAHDGDVVDLLRDWTGRAGTFLVVLDQFEEYFQYHPGDDLESPVSSALVRIVTDANLRVNFLISIREDAWAKLDRYKGHVPHLFSNYLRVEYLDRESARRAIELPLEAYNAQQPGARFEIEPALTDTVLTGVGHEDLVLAQVGEAATPDDGRTRGAAATRIETPFLQMVMDRLWEAELEAGSQLLRLETLERLGGPAEIIRSHLERSMAGLDADEAAIAAEAFRFLVTPSRTKIAQRTSDLAWWSGRSEAEVGAVLERLASGRRGRLLRPLPPHPGERSVRYEIFHDVLGEAILDWRKRHEQEQETKELASRLEREKGERLEEERLRHQAQVNRLLRRSAAALVALVLLLAVATAVALRQRGEADAERRVAESQALALSAVAQLESDPELSVLLGRQAWETDRNRNAEQALRRAVSASRVRGRLPVRGRGLQTDADPSGRVLALAERDRVRLWDVRRRRWMAGAPLAPGGAVEWVLWSDDGRTVAVAGKERVLVRRLGETVTRSVGAGGPMADVALSADGRHVATARGRTVTVRSIAGGGTERTLRHPWPVADVEFDPSGGRRLATATCDDGNVRVWSWARGTARILRTDGTRSTHPPSAPSEAACVAAYSPDGRQLATAVRTDEPRVWDARTGRRVSEEDLLFVDEQVEALGWDPTGSTMVILARNLLYVAEPDGFPTEVVAPGAGSARSDTGVQATGGVHAGDDVFRVATFSRDGRHLAAGTGGGAIVVVDAVTGRRELTLRGHGEGIGDVAFLEGDQLASASADGTARVWDAEVPRYVRAEEPDPRSAGDGVAPFEPPAAPDGPELDDPSATFGNLPDDLSALSGAAYSPDGERVAIADLAGRVRVVDLDDGRLVQVRTRMRAARSVRFADDGRLVVAAGGTPGRHVGGVTVADARTGRVVHRLRFDAEVVSAELSPDRRAVLAVTADGGALERRLRGGAPRRLSWPDGSTVNSARFSPDGRRVLAAGGDGILRIFDARSHELLEQFELRSGGSLYGSAFSPDGRRVVAYGSARHARVLDARTGREIATLRGHEGPVMSAAFSTDGRLIVTGSTDRTVRVWGATTGLVHAVEEIHSGAVNSVAFAPATPTAILTAGNDGSARILRCRSCGPMDEVLALADAGRTRTLTPAERRDFLP